MVNGNSDLPFASCDTCSIYMIYIDSKFAETDQERRANWLHFRLSFATHPDRAERQKSHLKQYYSVNSLARFDPHFIQPAERLPDTIIDTMMELKNHFKYIKDNFKNYPSYELFSLIVRCEWLLQCSQFKMIRLCWRFDSYRSLFLKRATWHANDPLNIKAWQWNRNIFSRISCPFRKQKAFNSKASNSIAEQTWNPCHKCCLLSLLKFSPLRRAQIEWKYFLFDIFEFPSQDVRFDAFVSLISFLFTFTLNLTMLTGVAQIKYFEWKFGNVTNWIYLVVSETYLTLIELWNRSNSPLRSSFEASITITDSTHLTATQPSRKFAEGNSQAWQNEKWWLDVLRCERKIIGWIWSLT